MTLQAHQVTIAVDVGGTGLKCALVDSGNAVRHSERHPTRRERGPGPVVGTILAAAAGLADRARAEGLTPVAAGVVVPGVVNEAAGIIEWAGNLGFRDVPLRDLVRDRLGLPTALGHDVRAGALAEARLGAGRGRRRMFFVAIGTGIAGGFALDGRIDPGAHFAAGEIGHVIVRSGAGAEPCACGNRGCLESVASAAAIARRYAGRSAGPAATTADIAALASAGDPVAAAVWREAVDALADGLLSGIALFDPEVLVLGGGLAEAGPLLLDPLRAALEQRRTFHRLPDLVRAALGDSAGSLGASLLAAELLAAELLAAELLKADPLAAEPAAG